MGEIGLLVEETELGKDHLVAKVEKDDLRNLSNDPPTG